MKDILKRIALPAAVLLFLGTLLAAVCGGSQWLCPQDLFTDTYTAIVRLRLERILIAAMVGGALAMAGTATQAVLRNVLAEPYVLGISGGASLGAALAIISGMAAASSLALPAGAFIGALVALSVVIIPLGRSDTFGNNTLLAGVIVGSVCSSLLMLLISVMHHVQLNSIVWWLLGNLQGRDPALIPPSLIIVFCCGIVLFLFAREANALTLGSEMAHYLGVPPARTARIMLIAAALLTACAVSLAGIIGFVGLVVPHFMRFLVGADHRKLFPAALFGGAWFMIACDLLSRSIYQAQELPVGVITALIGGPMFIYLLYRSKTRMPGD